MRPLLLALVWAATVACTFTITGPDAVFTDCNVFLRTSAPDNGRGNLVLGRDHRLLSATGALVQGEGHTVSGDAPVAFGVGHQILNASYGGVFGGRGNEIIGPIGTAIEGASIHGGQQHLVAAPYASISGGYQSQVHGEWGWIEMAMSPSIGQSVTGGVGKVVLSAVAALNTGVVSAIIASGVLRHVAITGLLQVSTAGTMQIMARVSATGNSLSVRGGYLNAWRIG